MIATVLHVVFAVTYAENFRGGASFVTIVWRRKSTLREVPKARPS